MADDDNDDDNEEADGDDALVLEVEVAALTTAAAGEDCFFPSLSTELAPISTLTDEDAANEDEVGDDEILVWDVVARAIDREPIPAVGFSERFASLFVGSGLPSCD